MRGSLDAACLYADCKSTIHDLLVSFILMILQTYRPGHRVGTHEPAGNFECWFNTKSSLLNMAEGRRPARHTSIRLVCLAAPQTPCAATSSAVRELACMYAALIFCSCTMLPPGLARCMTAHCSIKTKNQVWPGGLVVEGTCTMHSCLAFWLYVASPCSGSVASQRSC